MDISNDKTKERSQVVQMVEQFLKVKKEKYHDSAITDNIREVCVDRLCKAIGVDRYYYKNDFFSFFSQIMGEAVCRVLNIKLTIACDALRLVKYNKVNLVDEMKMMLETRDLENAFLDAFDLVDQYKFLIPHIKRFEENNG